MLEFDGAGALLARYSHGDRVDQPLTIQRGGQSYFYHTDHLGSIRLVTDAAGAVVNSYDYDAYGNFEAISETVVSPYAYTGREYDGESGLHYYRARYYDPQTGRFLQEDPLGFAAGDANLYRYVFNNPVNLTDPGGRAVAVVVPVVVAALEALVEATVLYNIGQEIIDLVEPLLQSPADEDDGKQGEGEEEASGAPPSGGSCSPADPRGERPKNPNAEPAPFLPDDPFSPENVDRRRSDRREEAGVNRDPDTELPDRGPGSSQGGQPSKRPKGGRKDITSPHLDGINRPRSRR